MSIHQDTIPTIDASVVAEDISMTGSKSDAGSTHEQMEEEEQVSEVDTTDYRACALDFLTSPSTAGQVTKVFNLKNEGLTGTEQGYMRWGLTSPDGLVYSLDGQNNVVSRPVNKTEAYQVSTALGSFAFKEPDFATAEADTLEISLAIYLQKFKNHPLDEDFVYCDKSIYVPSGMSTSYDGLTHAMWKKRSSGSPSCFEGALDIAWNGQLGTDPIRQGKIDAAWVTRNAEMAAKMAAKKAEAQAATTQSTGSWGRY